MCPRTQRLTLYQDAFILFQQLGQMLQIQVVVLFFDKRLNLFLEGIGDFVGWASACITVNGKLDADLLISLKVTFNSSAGLIQELGSIEKTHFPLSDLGDHIHGELSFRIHHNHPSQPLNMYKEYSENH